MDFNDFLNNLTIVFPVYNEEKRIKNTEKKLLSFSNQFLNSSTKLRIIFVVDGSTDDSFNILKQMRIPHANIKVVHYPVNQGIGYAMKQGILNTRTKFVLVSDFDLSTPLDELKKIFHCVESNDVVIGTRDLNDLSSYHSLRSFLSRVSFYLIKLVLGINVKDTQTGFKLYSTSVAKKLFSISRINRFGIDFEIVFLAKKFKLDLISIPVRWNYEKYSTVRFIDYFKTLKELFLVKYNDLRGHYDSYIPKVNKR